MWCEAQFAEFNERIKLDSTRSGRINSAIAEFIAFCQKDEKLLAALSEQPFLQGSVLTKTVIKPLANDEFDVDVIYPFSLNRFRTPRPGPQAIIKWFVDRLKKKQFYADRLIPKSRCARIDYAGDFHLDIIPSTTDVEAHQPYAVPARDLATWTTNDPQGFAQWVRQCDERGGGFNFGGGGRFVRGVRLMKRWRDQFFGEKSAVSSILLVTMLGKHEPTGDYRPSLQNPLYPKYRYDAAYLYDMLRITHSCIINPPHNAFKHPTIPDEDLARGWDTDYLSLFLKHLTTCINELQNGIYAETEEKSIEHYRLAFGDTFPAR